MQVWANVLEQPAQTIASSRFKLAHELPYADSSLARIWLRHEQANMKLLLVWLTLSSFSANQAGAQQADFWPFHVGNVWEYQHLLGAPAYPDDGEPQVATVNQVILSIDATEVIDGKTYFRFNNGQLLRKDEAGNVYEYLNRFAGMEEGEYLILDFFTPNSHGETHIQQIPYALFPPTPGRSIGVWPQQRDWVTSPLRRLVPPWGNFQGYFSFGYSLGVAETYSYAFADGVGLIFSSQGSDVPSINRYELVRATINGRKHPTRVESSRSWGALKLLAR